MELLTPAEMAKADRHAIETGTSGFELMQRAGDAVARVALRVIEGETGRRQIIVLCGPGNNGGDGFIAAKLLAEAGHTVVVSLLGSEGVLRGDAAAARRQYSGPLANASLAKLDGSELIIDALFGAGLSRPVEGDAAALLRRINGAHDAGALVIAIDLPSGISGATGAILGEAVMADETVTFFRRKPGHLLYPGRGRSGRVHVENIGISADAIEALNIATFMNAPALWAQVLPSPASDGHKYDRGHTLILAGGIEGCGASRLAARAALRVGSGLVTLAVPSEALASQAAANTAVMVRRADGPRGWMALLADRRRNVAALGPAAGVGEETVTKVLAALSSKRMVVIDADGLTSFAEKPELLFGAIKEEAPGAAVLTPHEGEFARLFHAAPEFVALGSGGQNLDKLSRARLAAQASGAVIVLKGADTVIAAPDGRAAINENATPYLATAGSGDALTGIIGGLLAQKMPAFEAACAGVWIHAQAGIEFGPGLIAEDLPEMLPRVLRGLHASLQRGAEGGKVQVEDRG
ncbi:MAG: NAD(P)H-hydrate dehydratase [Hyphomicrobiales bacterium]|nr:NAD(P)H-hydrate dehydratase [Hyphomicrobiales bacterium]